MLSKGYHIARDAERPLRHANSVFGWFNIRAWWPAVDGITGIAVAAATIADE